MDGKWASVQQAEVDVSLVKEDYIIDGKIDLVKGVDGTVEIVDFKSERKPDMVKMRERLEHYRRQLQIYAYLIEQRTGQKVSKMHLYYTGEENGNPMITYPYTRTAIEGTVAAFDDTVHKILRKDFKHRCDDAKTCKNCDFRYYTGTPYVNKQVLPEVVYAYGLNESIAHGYLKDADPIGFENVKNEEFLRTSITKFWERYGGKTYEGLLPKLAIFAANVKEATDVVRPAVEKVLSELGISLSTVLVNTGDPSVTKDEDIKNFNNLDVIGTEGSKKQFIILVEKGREGWNCRSLLGIALFRSPKSKVFVLQATMRCLRQLTKEQLKATIFLSKENYDTLDDELRKNYNMEISDFGKSPNTNKKVYKVRVLPPPRSIKMKRLWHEYSLIEKEYSVPIDFHLAELDESKYEAKMYEKGSLRLGLSEKETNIDSMKEQERFSEFSLTAEISRYMNISCLTIAKILRESVDGSDNIVAAVNRHNEILEDVIIPEIFHTLYEVKSTQKSEDVDMVLLREPKDSGYYEFSANDELVITKGHNNFTPKEEAKSFHADTYCFDSKPEKECFLQYISSNKVKEIYFTGMFTSNQGDLSVQYYDPESKRLRKYYPDFLALMEDGSYQLIEVKGDNKIDDEVVLAKKAAAEEMAVASGIHYLMYAGSTLMKSNVLEPTLVVQQASIDI